MYSIIVCENNELLSLLTSNQDLERAVGGVEAEVAHDHFDRSRPDGEICTRRVSHTIDNIFAWVVYDTEISPRHRGVVLAGQGSYIQVLRTSYVRGLSIWKNARMNYWISCRRLIQAFGEFLSLVFLSYS